MRKAIIIMVLVLLLSVTAVHAKEFLISTFELDGSLEITSMKVISNNAYYSDYYLDMPEQETNYRLFFKDKNDKTIYVTPLDNLAFTLIDFAEIEHAKKLIVSKSERILYEKQIDFCNNNDVCEPCEGIGCMNYENELICGDCNTNAKDNYCNLKDDKICDLDCVSGYVYDVENIYDGCFEEEYFKQSCEDYGLESCEGIEKCGGERHYLINSDEVCCLAECVDILEQDDSNKSNEKLILILVVLSLIIMVVLVFVYFFRKKKNKKEIR